MNDFARRFLSTLFLVATVDFRRAGALTDAEQQELIDIHTQLRAGEGASDMQAMKWSQELADMAQAWTDRCVFEHGQPYTAPTLGDIWIGQNLYATSGNEIHLTDAVNSWFSEKEYYNYDTDTCSDDCGHYTQVVWSESNLVGCGYTACPGEIILTCNYAPGGNYGGVRPYKTGAPCTQCSSGSQFCNSDNLCETDCTSTDCSCNADCKNSGTVTDDCSCQCEAGWTGPDCSVVCEDLDKTYCGGNPGYPSDWCGNPDYAFVDELCPAMCGKCVAIHPEGEFGDNDPVGDSESEPEEGGPSVEPDDEPPAYQ